MSRVVKKKNISKKLVAVLLSIIMLATSIPFAIIGSAAGEYDPAPYFDDAAQEKGASAWLDDDGNVQVVYPEAKARAAYNGTPISIAFYILELVDTGANNASHTKVVLDTIKATGTSATFKASDIGEIDLQTKRYSVTITAVDTENWFSIPIYATVVRVPAVTIDSSRFANLSTSPTAVREIMTFSSGSDDGAVTQGSQLKYMGSAAETGTVDLTDYVSDTPALRFIMHNQPTGTQAFDTSYSRQTWDFKGAEEIWYWLDLSDVQLTGLAFRLRTNEKMWMEWNNDNKTLDTVQRAGSTVYSTKGTAAATYTGEAPYVWVQREDGGWNKVMLKNDGTLDIGNFKGYVRIPLKFMCSETDSYVDISNQELAVGTKRMSGNSVNESSINSWLQSMTFGNILVDPAGTSVTNAMLIHRRGYLSASGFLSMGTRHLFLYNANGITHLTRGYPNNPDPDYSKTGYMLAVPLDTSAAKTSVTTGNYSSDRAYISSGAVQNREAGLKAIEDIYNAGFSVEGCSSDSLSHSFYIDNIFFYRTDGGKYTENTLDGNASNTGNPISDYYNEELAIQTLIFDEIDEHLVTPGWEDYREINYILDLIEAYRQIFEANGKSTAFLDLSKTDDGDGVGLAAAAAKLQRDSWANAWKAYEACVAEGTYGRANAGPYDLIPTMVRLMEKLPHPDNIATVSDALRDEIIKLWKGYSLLNLGQLEMLGKEEEELILKYIALLEGNISDDFDELIVGTSLSNRPFILFDDFETYNLGTKSYQLEDAPDIYYDEETAYTDYRYTKNFVTYMPDTFEDFGGKSKDTDNSITAFLWGKQPTKNGFADNLIPNVTRGEITDRGFQGTKGATIVVDGNRYKSGEGYYNVVSTTYKGAEAANIDALRATGTGNSNVLLGNMAKSFSGGTIDPYLSLVFYVDFTQITDFNLSATIQTYFDDSLNDFQIAMGTSATDQNFFILDETTGEWIRANNAEDAGRMFAYTSKAGSDINGDGVFDITLAGYKGFVRIPLYHFKPGNNSQKLDESSLALNNIYRISIGVAPGSQAGADQMYGKSFTIDNIGFTYDPVQYSDKVATRTAAGVVDKNFDEFFGAKSLPAKQFEDAVENIDIYHPVFSGDVVVARNMYNALTDYQKTVVADAEAVLREYELYANGTKEIPKAQYTVTELETFVNTLPDAIKNSSVTEEYDIPYPGFSNGAVNYSAMGINRETAEQIIEYYNYGYSRFSNEQKTTIMNQTARAQFLNAYNMAMRLTTTLENIKVNAVGEDGRSGFLADLTGLYTVKYDYNDDGVLDDKDNGIADSESYKVGNFVSIDGKQEVADFKAEKYDILPYYSKISIDDGSIYEGLKNTSRGFTYFLSNTREFNIDGETINGGIINFRDKLQVVYDIASEHIENKVRFTQEELQYVKDILEEYNALLPAYYNVEELYELEQAIIRLFPVSDIAVMDAETNGAAVDKVSLNNDSEESMTKTVYVDLSYIAAMLDQTVTLQAVSDLKLTQVQGTTYSSLDSFTATSLTADAAVELGEYDNLYPNETFARIPIEISVNPTVAARVPTGAVYEGSVTFNVYNTADIDAGLTGDDLVPIATLELPVEFVSTNGQNPIIYKVEIPADQNIEWDYTEKTDVSYKVIEANLDIGSLDIGVADANEDGDGINNMTSTKTEPDGTAYKLKYNAEGFETQTFTGSITTETLPNPAPSITIEQASWDAVAVGEYKTTLTYTVVYKDGSTS